MPTVDSRTREASLSVYQTSGLTPEDTWAIGLTIAVERGRSLYGRGDLTISDVRASELAVVLDNDPPMHASIVGWPPDKDVRMDRAKNLAKRATLVLVSTNH